MGVELGVDIQREIRDAWIDAKALRAARGWIQQEAAERLGISRTYLSYLENGKCDYSANVINAFIRVFDLKLDDFYTGIEDAGKRGQSG